MRIKIAAIVMTFLSGTLLFSQPAKFTQIEDADEHLKHGNYLMAIPVYKTELKKEPDDLKIKYKLGICYLHTRLNYEEAVTYLEIASKDPKTDEEVWLHLGRAYHLTYRMEDAVTAFEKFKTLRPKRADEADRFIAQCENALRFIRTPTKATFQNPGQEINSPEPDYNPFINQDETFMVFTSRRKENLGGKKVEIDGYRSSDIYQSNLVNGNWTSAKNAGRGVNGTLDEQAIGLRHDGMEMYLYIDRIDRFGDIYISTRKEEAAEFSKPKIFDPVINEKIETSGCLNEDGSLLVFARREDLNSTSDLFLSRKLPTGKWGIPLPLPETINTPFNEDQPYLSVDGETLYFASDGHNSMGGFDLYKSRWNQSKNTFSDPENLGFPINSTDDDRSICVTKDNRLAYVSSFRPNGFGDLDIYRVKFNETEPVSVIFTGQIYFGDTLKSNKPNTYAVSIIVTNVKTNYEYTFVPHSKTGRYVMALPAGKYMLSAYATGYQKYYEAIEVNDFGKLNTEKHKSIVFKKIKKT